MNKTAIIYSFNSNKTAKVAEQIKSEFNDDAVELVNAEDVTASSFLLFDQFILGVPTWFDGELPNYWDEFVPEIEDMDLNGKRFALYGLGDQKGYPENYQDGIGIMAELLEEHGGEIVGSTSTEGYTFESSKAVRDNSFLGLAIDYENQASKNKTRIPAWVESLKKVFK
jgi:flavodoxin I